LEKVVSDNVRSYGFIAAILEGSELPDLEELNEKLWEEKASIRVNYEGTLVFADYSLTKWISELFIWSVGSMVFISIWKP
jgi:hypothetical protein